jgi:hypothetical protein
MHESEDTMSHIATPTFVEIARTEAERSSEATGILDASGRPIQRDHVGHFVLESAPQGAEEAYLRLNEDTPEDENYQPGLGLRVLSLAKRAACFAVAASFVAVPALAADNAQADVIDPFNYLQSSYSPSQVTVDPAGGAWGDIVGADGIDNGNKFVIAYENGNLSFFNDGDVIADTP